MNPKNAVTAVVDDTDTKLDASTLSAAVDTLTDFLDHYGAPPLVGQQFAGIIGTGGGQQKLNRLLAATGHDKDAAGLCRVLIERLAANDSRQPAAIEINGIRFPHLLLVALLEIVLPGDRFTTVKSVQQLEALIHSRIPDIEHGPLQQVLEKYPVRLSTHVIRQMRVSRHVAYQYLPFVEELDPAGHVNTWIGQFHQGLLEQMYQNRVIFLLNMSCPVYCRFCFRKHKDSRHQPNPTAGDVLAAVDHVARTPTIKEIVITGGDPFMNRKNLYTAIEGLMAVDHVQTLRLATRSIAYYPNLFYAGNGSLLKYIKAKNLELQLHGKRLEIATHFIHPDEISIQSLDLITQLVQNGMPVYVQTPFLKDCNDQGPELTKLFSLLRGAGAELHYIYIPCSPIQGNSIYWTPISKGLQAANYLRAHLSDRVIPRICTATPIGKMDWHTSGWAVERDPENDRFIWIRTPYTPAYFKAFAPIANELDIVRVNAEGTIDARYMADIGDDDLLLGPRRQVPAGAAPSAKDLPELQRLSLEDQRIPSAIVATGVAGIDRAHETRMEIDLDRWDGDLGYLKSQDTITDVVLTAAGDMIDRLHQVEEIADGLADIGHVNAVRLRSLLFNYRPERFTTAAVNRLGRLNRLTIAAPLRLEIETQFLHAREITPAHRLLTERLRARGVTVYCNTPLLGDVNDSADEISRLAYRLRQAGIEFHHLYVAGLPLQNGRGKQYPVDVARIIDIGTQVRREGSGREIPRYILKTLLGEVDFGLTSTLSIENGRTWVRLTPYDLDYYRRMQPDFDWPAQVRVDTDGRPLVPVEGLTDSGGFMVSRSS